jgi:hypothetical protein
MKFLVIEPQSSIVRTIAAADFQEALLSAGLEAGEIDFGQLSPHLHMAVYQYGLFEPPAGRHYFTIASHLYAGNAVVYGVDGKGVTVDVAISAAAFGTACHFMHSERDVERAFREYGILRPQIRVNGELIWQWPQAAPEPFATKMKEPHDH